MVHRLPRIIGAGITITELQGNEYHLRIDRGTKKARVENGGSHTLLTTMGPGTAERKPSDRLPQAEHGYKSKSSRHDKRNRLGRTSERRRHTTEPAVPLCGGLKTLADSISHMLDARSAFRLLIVITGIMLAGGHTARPLVGFEPPGSGTTGAASMICSRRSVETRRR